ncbi:hypothetical protein Nepgr_017765 [Nepenthes gracilis]|uniref:Epidermal patterning factor-like protein n=1 Tax=Nepenthes gracilis TaxID=150966 RepID=A0AAD3SS95_NEPGR|nr:hypothetical protein Nepgr_017765 [Nepenthes gracilis]
MAPRRRHQLVIRVTVTLAFIISFSNLPFKSIGLSSSSGSVLRREKEAALGSRPPGCENKCMNCKPCMATLVVPPHQKKKKKKSSSSSSCSSYHGDDDSYYLLSWKCKCGNKLFQP